MTAWWGNKQKIAKNSVTYQTPPYILYAEPPPKRTLLLCDSRRKTKNLQLNILPRVKPQFKKMMQIFQFLIMAFEYSNTKWYTMVM